MNTKRVYIFLSFLIGISSISTYGQDSTGEETGKKIGTIVKTAIDTALPGVSSLVDLIWGNRRTNDRMTRTDVENQLTTARRQLKAEAQTKLEPMNIISQELGLLNKFLEPSVKANLNIIRMQTRLLRQESMADADWQEQKIDWDVAKNSINQIKNISDNDISNVREKWLRNMLKKIRDANNEDIIRAQGYMDQKNSKSLIGSLEKISNTLQDVPAAIGYELSDLQSDVKDLGNWASAGMGTSTEVSDQQKRYKAYLEKRYPN